MEKQLFLLLLKFRTEYNTLCFLSIKLTKKLNISVTIIKNEKLATKPNFNPTQTKKTKPVQKN